MLKRNNENIQIKRSYIPLSFVSESGFERILDLNEHEKPCSETVNIENDNFEYHLEAFEPKNLSIFIHDEIDMNYSENLLDYPFDIVHEVLERPSDILTESKPNEEYSSGSIGVKKVKVEAFLYGERVDYENDVEDEFLRFHPKADDKPKESPVDATCSESIVMEEYDLYGLKQVKEEPESDPLDIDCKEQFGHVALIDHTDVIDESNASKQTDIEIIDISESNEVQVITLSGRQISVSQPIFETLLKHKLCEIVPKAGTAEKGFTFKKIADVIKTQRRRNKRTHGK